jgi:hypothetical protein
MTTNAISPVISLAALTLFSQCPLRNAHRVPIRQLPDGRRSIFNATLRAAAKGQLFHEPETGLI